MKRLSILLLSLLAFVQAWHQAVAEQPVPPLRNHVTDLTGTLSPTEIASLEDTLAGFEGAKGSQVAVLIVATTEPETIEQYAIRVAEVWKLGRKKVDDGAILIVAKNDRTVRIEVGYGLEGPLSDIVAKRIIEDRIIPRFKQGDFYGGIRDAVDSILKVISGEALPPPSASSGTDAGGSLIVIFMAALIVGSILAGVIGRLPAAGLTGAGSFLIGSITIGTAAGIILALVLFALLVANPRSPGSRYYRSGGFGGGFGGGTGSFGGGFSGGGGSFGGGGASGRW